MTGFGLASSDQGNVKFAVEIKSLNSKFLELNLKLPRAYSDKELLLRNVCSKDIERGKVNIAVNIERSDDNQKGATINAVLLTRYYKQLEEINVSLGANSANLLQTALTFPEVITYTEEEVGDNDWEILHQTFSFRINKLLQRDYLYRESNSLICIKLYKCSVYL